MNTSMMLLLLCTAICTSEGFGTTDPNFGTEAVNFNWNYLYFYGGQNTSSNSSNVLSEPSDFILLKDNQRRTSSLVSDWINDIRVSRIKQFTKNSGDNFTVLAEFNSYVYSLEQISPDTFAFGTENYTLINNGSIFFTFGGVKGLGYQDGLLYVADHNFRRVLVVNISSTLAVAAYGAHDLNHANTDDYPTNQNIGNPARIRIGCHGDLWVVDSMFRRILKYKAGAAAPAELVWGQPSFNSSNSTPTQNGFYYPTDIVFDKNCSVAFVAERGRILRFQSPFVSSQSAVGVLGAGNFTSKGSFGSITRLQLEESESTMNLYILDSHYNRILVGQTVQIRIISPVPRPLTCSETTKKECLVQGEVLLEGAVLIIPANYTLFIITSQLNMDNRTQITMGTHQQIQAAGNVTLAGSLTVVLSTFDSAALQSKGSVEITLITTNGTMVGEFGTVIIDEGSGAESCGVTKREEYTGKSMKVLMTKGVGCGADSQERGGNTLSGGAIAGIVIGVSAGVLIVVAVVGVGGGFLAWRLRKTIKAKEDDNGLGLAL